MSRKRLGGIDPSRARDARTSAEESARSKRSGALGAGPPIAQVAASVSGSIATEVAELKRENKALQEKGRAHDLALDEGRVVVSLDLADVDPMALSRDRRQLQRDGEDWAALKASILARGQQSPIEVTKKEGEAEVPYELVSGLRRWSVLEELHRETGDRRYAKVLAFVRRMPDTIPKMIAMIEENEIRQDISFFERGRVCAVSVAEGLFNSVDEAINVLFENSNRNRRYKIRCFVTVYEEIGTLLDFPEELGERVGIALAKALREGRGEALTRVLENRDARFVDAGQELALLNDFLSQRGQFAEVSAAPAPREALVAGWTGGNGAQIVAKASGSKIMLALKNMPRLEQDDLEALVEFLGYRKSL